MCEFNIWAYVAIWASSCDGIDSHVDTICTYPNAMNYMESYSTIQFKIMCIAAHSLGIRGHAACIQ